MIIVVDSNIVFSALLSHKSAFLDILQDTQYKFFAPNFIFTEIFKYKEKILKHSKLTEDELLEALSSIFSLIQLIPQNSISYNNRLKAGNLCEGIDAKDAIFVALTLEFDAVLWTGDKKLKNGLLGKGFQSFFNIQHNS